MPETSDLQQSFDDLARDVRRAVGPGDVERPIRRARRRRAVAGAAALAVVAALGFTATQLTVGDSRSGDPEYVDTRPDPAPGASRRERLLGLLQPAQGDQVNLLDVVGFTGEPGLSLADEQDRQLLDYLNSPVVTLLAEPFVSLLLPDLVSHAGTGATDLFLVDRPPEDISSAVVRAGWEEDGDVLVPGSGSPKVARRVAPYVTVTEESGLTLVGISRTRDTLPGQASDTSALAPPATRLLDLGGAVGVSLGPDLGSCTLLTASLSSPTSATVLLRPPPGVTPEEVTTDRLQVPDAFERISGVEPDGELVRVAVTMESASAPIDLLRRLGLPGTEFC